MKLGQVMAAVATHAQTRSKDKHSPALHIGYAPHAGVPDITAQTKVGETLHRDGEVYAITF